MIFLPPYFEKDIQGQNLNLYPVILIGTYTYPPPEGYSDTSSDFGGQKRGDYHLYPNGTYNNNQNPGILPRINGHTTIYSTRAGEVVYSLNNHPVSTKPLLLNIPSIKESMDFENRNYKISNVNLDISNYEYEGERFSDYAGNLINKEVRILWFSQSTQGWTIYPPTEGSVDGLALHVYKGFIRRYSHDDEKCTLQLEDSTQKDLHKDVPVAKLGATEDVPDKYKLKPIPMVYGEVDNSPLVIKEFILSTGEGLIVADNTEFGAKIVTDAYDSVNPLKISSDDSYHHILKSSVNYSRWGYDSSNQYIHSDGDGFVTFISPFTSDTLADNVENKSPLADNAAEAIAYVNPNRYKLFSAEDNYTYGEIWNGFGFYEAVNIGDEVTTGHNFFVDDSGEYDPGTMKHYYYKLMYYFDSAFDAFDDDYYSKFSYDVDLSLTEVQRMDTSMEHYHRFSTGRHPDVHSHHEHFSTDDVSENLVGTTLGIGDGWANTSEKEIRILCGWQFLEWSPSSGDIMECQAQIIINKIQLEVNYLKKDFSTSDFYANVNGRTNDSYET